MWYVVQVRTGDELKISGRLQLEVKGDGEEVFVPLFERRKCIRGEWTKVMTPLFPGYVFFQTNDIEDVYGRLIKINAFTRILKTGDCFTPIASEEEWFIDNLTDSNHIVEQSIGVIEGDQIIVKRGPLYGLEGSIVKINRHKRIAIVKADFMGGPREIKVGLEIIDKRPSETQKQ